ncbi:hypothetical protein RHMOL_Rhmol11G0201400 [Rhododendron molle]|uniref:Uncharacterized protein n=1 Tax=Rhododendron molle TaxID=49168 RepID=A0ACC0LVL8_RHOML|nr:hypothetical protein RHMOL_Rhmol11G0201400 [Rhododendron molle]
MQSIFILVLLTSFINAWFLHLVGAKVFMVLMDEDPYLPHKSSQDHTSNVADPKCTRLLGFIQWNKIITICRKDKDAGVYRERLISGHDIFLDSLLQRGTFTKLYSYTHVINGFAVHTTSEKVIHSIRRAKGVRAIHEDIKMEKFTTHTPDFLGIPMGVWPTFGGARNSGEGVVIGLVDTGINPFHPSFTSHHTASIAAGNYHIPVVNNNFTYGYASGMAPAARISMYKALYTFGGYMSDVVAAVDQAVEDGVDILSLSIGPANVPSGPSAFLSVLETVLLFATRAGVLVIQAAGNGGPTSSSILSFSPWITSVASSITDRKYRSSIKLGNGQLFTGTGLSPPTAGEELFPIATAADVSQGKVTTTSPFFVDSCQNADSFIPYLVQGKLIICTYTPVFEFEGATIGAVAETIQKVGAAGFILATDHEIRPEQIENSMFSLQVPSIFLNNMQSTAALLEYYNTGTIRSKNGSAVHFNARARILEGRHAIYTGKAPVVASYSSRGPDVNNALLQTADVLKPNIMAPGSSIWAAWSPNGEGDPYSKGEEFALLSGTSMATPHIAGVAALIKQKHPHWSPSAILSAMITTADVTDESGSPLLAQNDIHLANATPFDFGAGFINPARAIDPGLVFEAGYYDYVQFLCAVPGVDDMTVRRAVGVGCPKRKKWCSDLNTASLTVSNLVGSRKVIRRLSNVGSENERYKVVVREPLGVRVRVFPQVFEVKVNASTHLRIVLEATEATNRYTFGELVLQGNRKHVVRVPIAVFAGSPLGS